MKNKGYSIKDLEVLTGIKAHTIRVWEKRYGLLVPQRTDTNIRFYSDDELRKMLNVSYLVKNGFKISRVSAWSEEKVNRTVLEISKQKTSESDYLNRLILSMVNFDNESFYGIMNDVVAEMGLEDAVTHLFSDFFVRVGTYWQVGSVFPAQEHYVTNIFRQKLIAEIDKLEPEKKKKKTVLFFLHEKELHEISLLFYSYLAKKMGYNVIYLGQFVPWADLVKIREQMKIDIVFTAFINSITKEELENYIAGLKTLFSPGKVLVTGWQVREHKPQLPRNVKLIGDYKEFRRLMR